MSLAAGFLSKKLAVVPLYANSTALNGKLSGFIASTNSLT